MSIEKCFDLLQLDAVPADFDLMVNPTEPLYVSVGKMARQVSRPEHSRIRILTVRIMHKFLSGQLGPLQVTARDTLSADIKLAWHTDRHRFQIRIEDIELCIVNRLADGYPADARVNLPNARPNSRLGGAVEIPYSIASLQQTCRQIQRYCFAATQDLELLAPRPSGFYQHPPSGGRCLHDRRAGCFNVILQPLAINCGGSAGEYDARADRQRQENLERSDVEGDGGD